MATNVTFNIRRFNPEEDKAPRWQQFTVPVEEGMTVLDGLHWIKENQDASLSYRFSCRMGVCGSCAMLINGIPSMACNTQVLHITDKVLTLAPLPNFHVIKDLVPDLMPMLEKHASIMTFLQRKDTEEMENPTWEYMQSVEELDEYFQFTYCMKCGCCMAACPGTATDREYLGPMPLAQAYRWNSDSRDDGEKNREKVVTSPHGVFSCHYAGECSNVCPKGVDPARAIQLMKKELVLGYLRLKAKKESARVVGPPTGEPKPKVEVPAYTVEQK